MLLTAVLIPAIEGGYIALNPETGSTTQGESFPEALANLREATELYLDEFPVQSAGQPLVTTFEVAHHAYTAARFWRGGRGLSSGSALSSCDNEAVTWFCGAALPAA